MRTSKHIILLGCLMFIVAFYGSANTAIAGSAPVDTIAQGPRQTTLFVPIGGLTDSKTAPGEYIQTIFKWGIGLAALVAMMQLVLGGVMYTLSAGSITNQEGAKERIKHSIIGLILLISCVTILTTINPKLVGLQPISATDITQKAVDDLISTYKNTATTNPGGASAIKTSEYGAAAAAADARLAEYGKFEHFSECFEASREGKLLKEEIADYVRARKGAGIADPFSKFNGTDGDSNPLEWLDSSELICPTCYSDFREYLGVAQTVFVAGDLPLYRCWQDMLISSVNYAASNIDAQSLNAMANAFQTFEKSFGLVDAPEYMKSNPFNKKTITPAQIQDEILATDESANTMRVKYYTESVKEKIDAGKTVPAELVVASEYFYTHIDNFISENFRYYKTDTERFREWNKYLPYIQKITSYAKANLSAAQFAQFKKKFIDQPLTRLRDNTGTPIDVINMLFP